MGAPEVLTVGELRAQLDDAVTTVRTGTDAVVFVGEDRRHDAVLISADRYAELVAAERRAAVASALGSTRAEGLELDEYGAAVMRDIAEGRLSSQEASDRLIAHYRR